MENRVYIRDISMRDAQATFICDKLHFGPDQKNDLALSPVAVAFAAKEHLVSPYVPTYVEQLFRFTSFYATYYTTGPGKDTAHANERAAAAARVHFNLETKIIPENLASAVTANPNVKMASEMLQNHTVGPQVFVDVLCGAIKRNGMQSRSDVQSFDFRTLILVQEQYSEIPTYYLTENPATLVTEFVPAQLRQSH
jgi:glycerophosphoryl diester phosphodiesterase